jgi:hypothetical protein
MRVCGKHPRSRAALMMGNEAKEKSMTDRMARLVAIVTGFNREIKDLGMEYSAIVYDPATKRFDGKLEMFAVQNICDARADLLLEGYMAIRADSGSHQVEEYHRIDHSTVQ